jgi:hypothetical protein
MNKDLIVIIQSRSRPKGVYDVIKDLYNKCNSPDNFDILCIIDDDEVDLYKDIKDTFIEVKWSIVPHIENNWYPILKAQYDFISKNDYYFNWVIVDDIIDVSENWDLEIISKKNTYNDNIFALFTKTNMWGRNSETHKVCYDIYSKDVSNGDVIIHFNEMVPILTKKWVALTWDIFKEGDFSSSRELITCSLLYKLKKIHNISRFIETNVSYSLINNLDTELKKEGVSGNVTNSSGNNRDTSFYNMAGEDFNILIPTINKLYKQINND